jgi:hypothetical protein
MKAVRKEHIQKKETVKSRAFCSPCYHKILYYYVIMMSEAIFSNRVASSPHSWLFLSTIDLCSQHEHKKR